MEDHDFLRDLSDPDYRLSAPPPQKSSTFDSLVQELFYDNGNAPDAMDVDIEQDFVSDSKSTVERLTHWQPPTSDAGNCQQQPQQSVTSVAYTLERPVQMTQMPVNPPREGTTRESVPHLPGEILPSQLSSAVPALAVFRLVDQPPLRVLPSVDLDEFLEQPVSLVQGEVSQYFSLLTEMPELPPPSDEVLQPEAETPRVAMVKRQSITENADVDKKVEFIQDAVKRYHNHGAAISTNGKVQVHEVVMVLLLAEPQDAGLANILSFCTEKGIDTGSISNNFVARDTKTVGLIWQKIKSNKNANYDTFARAMRVGRERARQFFDYLDAGKGAKKRIYKLGPKLRSELDRMQRALVQLRSGH